MGWDIGKFETVVRSCDFFQRHEYFFRDIEVLKPGTKLERCVAYFERHSAERGIGIRVFPSVTCVEFAKFNANVDRLSTGDGFSLRDYLNQYQEAGIERERFLWASFEGDSFEEKLQDFLEFATGQMERYMQPILEGREWPSVKFDWSGLK